ncbi:hypothetical protein [Candidatus Methanocrinis natronophilus]|uniref:Uncharacterized protein n=1 Tax=Candidatus Methanocrinis natronophilus TaxID=3033396 RepID=A0ABT5XAR3_9EURY|nr:hypothetical protein [Candidatus Methanocrinis natronophilus]MDF0591737.1 hypothetical protein [Candidatus Methanocrinis natronophilus]
MKNQETASGRLPSIPEVVTFPQEDSSITGKINLSVAEENALLRERNRQLEAENAILGEKETATALHHYVSSTDIIRKLAAVLPNCPPEAQTAIREAIDEISALREREAAHLEDDAETFNAVLEALRTIQPGKESARFFRDSETRIQNAAPEDKPLVINARIKAASAMIRDSPPPSTSTTTEGPDPLRYDTRTLNQKRGEAIAAHAQKTGKAAIKSTEAVTVLETVEGRRLDRKTVHRAMDVARGILRASSEVVGGIRRLVIPSLPGGEEDRPQHVVGGGGDRGGVSRPRRWAVPWDGVD